MYIKRNLNVANLLSERSLFLLGPRQTGKSSYIRSELDKGQIAKQYNLLDRGLFLKLSTDPTLIRQEVQQKDLRDTVICIDEIQKIPELLDEVHLLIEERNLRFLLTGSSARKLKHQSTNLLGGRARSRSMHPLNSAEVGIDIIDILKVVNNGLLPFHYLSRDATEDLHAYVGQYLGEEISAEGLARNIPGFSRFLQVAAQANAQLLDYTGVANDAQLKRQTVRQWFQVLEDTLLGFELKPYTHTSLRKPIETAKFYLFDTGIVRALRGLKEVSIASKDFGDLFEQFIFMELKCWIDYRSPRTPLNFWRSTSQFEVDFIVGERVAIEVKSTTQVNSRDLRGLRALGEEKLMSHHILVCMESTPRMKDGVEILPWREFLRKLWADDFLN